MYERVFSGFRRCTGESVENRCALAFVVYLGKWNCGEGNFHLREREMDERNMWVSD